MKSTIKTLTLILICFGYSNSSFSQHFGYGDEFHDFIRKFRLEKDFQLENISFPLATIYENDTTFISKKDWEHIDHCFGCEFSSILFMGDTINFQAGYYQIVNDTDYVIPVYLMNSKKVQDFHFYKTGDEWKLSKLYFKGISFGEKESFFEFIDNFAVDTSFVRQRLSNDFTYITWNDFPNERNEVPVEIKWFANDEYLYERIYINDFNLESNKISLYIKGEGTGYHIEYYFERINNKWYLVKLINVGV